MKTSTEIGSSAIHVGEEKAIEYIAKAGFDAWDFSMFTMCDVDLKTGIVSPSKNPMWRNNYLAFARKLKQIGLDNGIVCNQSHAPFPTPWVTDYLKRAIECTAEAGGEICIIHPDNNKSPSENAELYLELLPFAKDHGVKIATENMFNWDVKTDESVFAACATPDSFCAHLNAVNDEAFVACLDIGHAEMRGTGTSAVEMIHALGDKLQALHIHDNDMRFDLHQIPFSMQIDYKPVVQALKKIRYHGYFTLEAGNFLKIYTKENVFDGVKKMSAAARRLADMYEEV